MTVINRSNAASLEFANLCQVEVMWQWCYCTEDQYASSHHIGVCAPTMRLPCSSLASQ